MLRRALSLLALCLAAGLVSGAVCADSMVGIAFLRSGDPYMVQRLVMGDATPEAAARLLLEGPTAAESSLGIVTAIPLGWSVKSVSVKGDYAVVDLGGVKPGLVLGDAVVDDIITQFKWTMRYLGYEAGVLVDGQPVSVLRPALPAGPIRPQVQFPEPVGVGSLSGKKVCIRAGHGYYWNGSKWSTQRPVYCAPLTQEDFHNVDHAILLKYYLESEGATVIDTREMDKNRGPSPYGGREWYQMGAPSYLHDQGYPASIYSPYTLVAPGTPGVDQTSEDRRASCEASDYRGADVYISLHTNGLNGDCTGGSCPTGLEMYYDSTKQGGNAAQSQDLANKCQDASSLALNSYFGAFPCRNACNPRDYPYTETHYPNAVACLYEFGFHDTCDRDALYMRDPLFTSAGMYGMYKGICQYFGVPANVQPYSAQYVSDDIPATVEKGQIRTLHITMRNRGLAWSEAHLFRLGAVDDSDPFAVGNRATVSGNVMPGGTYTFSITAKFGVEGTFTTDWQMVRDGVTWFGDVASKTITVTPSTDTQAPTVPANLRVVSRKVAAVDLAWDAATDNVAVWGYRVYRNGVLMGETTGTTFTDGGLESGVTYEWRVEAYDGAPNYSAMSSPVSGSTAVPQNLRSTGVTYCSVSLAWDMPTGSSGISGYRIYRNGAVVGTSAVTSFTDTLLQSDTDYQYQVDAYDSVPNYSLKSNTITAHTDTADFTPPTAPSNVRATSVTHSTSAITWSPSTDNVAVTGYRVYRNGAVLATVAGTSFLDSGLQAGMNYTYAVDAFDAMLNYSPLSDSLPVDTHARAIFTDGFDGSVGNWTLESGTAFQYSTGRNHGTYTGAGSAFAPTGGGHLMYHWLDPKASLTSGGYVSGILEGWLYDTQGAYSGMRTGLRLLGYDSAGAKKVEYWVGTYNSVGFPTHYIGAVWAGAWIYYDLGVTRSVNWHKLGIEVLPYTGSGDLRFHCDGTVRTVSQPTAAAAATFRRAYMGYYLNVNADNYLDDITFDCSIPAAPSALAGVATGTNSIRWNFTDNANNEIGFRIHDGAAAVAEVESANAAYIDETGLLPNALCTRTARAYAGVLQSEDSGSATACTLSAALTPSAIVADPAPGVLTDGSFEFTSLLSFGLGGVQYYRYVLDQNPTHSWTGSEAVWDSDVLVESAPENGNNWYLHLRGYNALDVPNGSLDLGPFCFSEVLSAKELADGTVLKLSGKVVSAVYSGEFYVVELDRVSGIKVVSTTAVQIGSIVDVTGTIRATNGERYIQATGVVVR